MLKLLLTLAAVIAITAAVSSDTQGLEFPDLQDSDTEDLLADVSDELDVADELHLDDEVAESSSSSSSHSENANDNHIAPEPAAPAPEPSTHPKPKKNDDNEKTKCTKQCCPRGSYGTPGGSCTSCPPNHGSESTANGIQDAECKCPNESPKQCRACNACQHVVAGACVAKCSAPKKNCKTNTGVCY